MANVYAIRLHNKDKVTNFFIGKETTVDDIHFTTENKDILVFKKKYQVLDYIDNVLHSILHKDLTVVNLVVNTTHYKLVPVHSDTKLPVKFYVTPKSKPLTIL